MLYQQKVLQLWSRITYILRVGKCHKNINNRFCSHTAESLTPWHQINVSRPSIRGSAVIQQNHLLSEGKQTPPHHQQDFCKYKTGIIHKLRTGKYHQGINKRFGNYETESLTPWRQTNFKDHQQDILQAAAMEQDYLHTEDKQMPPDHQSDSEVMKQDHLHSRGRKMPQ